MNIVVSTGKPSKELYSSHFGKEAVFVVDEKTDMYDLLVTIGVYSSKKQAKRCWRQTGRPIPYGLNTFQINERAEEKLRIFFPRPTLVI